MFNSYKKIQFIDYQDSYYYQQKRKKQRKKWLKLILLTIVSFLLMVAILPLAQSQNINHQQNAFTSSYTENNTSVKHIENTLIYGPQLRFSHPDINHQNKINRIALPIDVNASIEISGLIAYTKIKQVFNNPYDIELEGKYQFPLPENSAIKHLTIKVGDKEIIGKIMEKKAAKVAYQKAKNQRRKASLVQQQRANLFTNNIANIPANSTVVVTLTFIMPVNFSNNELNINLPLAMTTRYQPAHYQQSPAEITDLPSNNANKNASNLDNLNEYKLTTPSSNWNVANNKALSTSQASIDIKLDSGVHISSIRSASHKVITKQLTTEQINTEKMNNQQSQYLISLSRTQTIANKNFNLTWQLEPSQKPQVSSFTEQVGNEYFTLLTFFPPHTEDPAVFSRDIIFIIDTSGSMQGSSIEQAKHSLRQAIALLTNKDSFNIIAFDNTADLLFSKTKMVTNNTITQAHQFIDNLQADGGTEMYRPLSQALVMAKDSKQSTQAIRQVVFITDGAVANEFELMQLLDGAQNNFRLFTVGIGAAPNGYFMKKAAQFGRGDYLYIQNINDVQRSISALMTKISQPAISNIELIFDNKIHQEIDVYPKKLTDLYIGEPMQVAIKSKLPITSIQLTGNSATQPWYHQLVINDTIASKGISTIWARNKIEDLLDSLVMGFDKEKVKQQVIATSLSHQIISPYTSFIAIEKQPEISELTTMQKDKNSQNQLNNLAKSHQNLLVALPKTALGWQQQLFIGLFFIVLALVSLRLKLKWHA
ncbi:MAG: marine proteobacterial sortase target protein [Thalassotalea sp.]|nr:marine proteobacterial sortase target protein [Thalassotalea sp.]